MVIRYILLLSFCYLFTYNCLLAASPTKFLIILKGTDESSNSVNEAFKKVSHQAKELYQKLGFQVLLLADSNGTLNAKNLIATLTDIKNASEVHIILLHHGIALNRKEFIFGSTSSAMEGADLKKGIINLKNNNPGVKIYIPTLSCYSGALANLLSDTAGVLVLPSSGWNRETVLIRGDNGPLNDLLSSLSEKKDFYSSQFNAWKLQFENFTTLKGMLIIATDTKSTTQSFPINELPLLRTQAELFLETWCDSKKNGEITDNKPLCTINESAQVKAIPENMKKIILQEFIETNSDHAKKLTDVFNKVKCGSPEKEEESSQEFNNFKTELLNKFIKQLTFHIEKITLDEFNKNSNTLQSEDLKKEELGILPKSKEEKRTIFSKKNFEDYKNYSQNLIQTFQSNCLKNSYSPENEFDEKTPDFGNCQTFIQYLIKPIVTTFSPQLISKDYEDDLDAINLLIPSSDQPIHNVFSEFNKNLLIYFKKNTSPIFYEDLLEILSLNLASQHEYCRLVKGNLSELENDLSCIKTFKNSAAESDWLRYLDIYNLSHQKLTGSEK